METDPLLVSSSSESTLAPASYTIQIEDLSLTFPIKKKKFQKKEKDAPSHKKILNHINATFEAGKMTAIMGASGAGKTTLLNALAGELSHKFNQTGRIKLNGQEITPKKLRSLAGYVYQDDVLLETMTVREAISMSAELRLPSSLSKREKEQKVDDLIEMLGLNKCQDTVIGSPLNKGVSGGERKRTSIAMELVTDPGLIYLDEPSSGQDSASAYNIIENLKDLAMQGKTIIATIHQPNSEIFQLFDNLCLLSEGEIVYHGPVTGVVEYFANLGFECPMYSNPADFLFMSVLQDSKQKKNGVNPNMPIFLNQVERTQFFINAWKKHTKKENTRKSSLVKYASHYDGSQGGYATGFLTQFWFLMKRVLKNLWRNPLLFKVKFVQVIFVGLLIGLIYFHIDDRSLKSQLQDRPGALYFICINLIMMYAFGVLNVFAEEKLVFLREYRNKYYLLPAYFLSKTVVELPFQIFFPLLQSILCYFMVFTPDPIKYLNFALVMILLANTGQAFGVLAASIFEDVKVALAIVPLFLLPFMIFSGLFINMDSIPVYFRWIKYISPLKYGFVGMIKNEYAGWEYRQDGQVVYTAQQALANLSLDNEISVYDNILVLLLMYVVMMFLSFFFLWRAVSKRL